MSVKNSKDFEAKIGVTFANQDLLKEALTHRSFLNENQDWPYRHNERLEFLGDAVLELIVTGHLYAKFPDFQEGYLTSLRAALVNYQMLARVARELTLEKYLFLSKGEARDFGKAREVILANAVEALIGAVYLDRGYDTAKELVLRTVTLHLDEVIEKQLYRDPKSLLQELVQEEQKTTPVYRVLAEEGPDHAKMFRVGVFIGEQKLAEAKGSSKQEAESKAAFEAITVLKSAKK